MKKLTYFITGILMCSNVSFAQLKTVIYRDGDQVLNGLKIAPKKQSAEKPGILLLPAWHGIDKSSKDIATDLANLGYSTFIADIYGEGNYPKDNTEAGTQSSYYKTNFKEYQKRISLALQQLIKSGAQADNIVIIGYCFGGTGALEAARGHINVKGVVSFHGGLDRDVSRPIEAIATKVLACHGADDPYVSQAEILKFQQEMRNTKADWQMIYYANAVHGFTNPEYGNDNSKGAAYNAAAARRSFEHLKLFLKEVLKK